MDPLSLLFSAIVSGAAAALKPTAEKAVTEGYEALKAIIKRKWTHVDVDVLERDPASEPRQQIVKESLQKTDGIADRDVLEAAQRMLSLVKDHDPDAAQGANIEIADLEAGANANIEDLVAEGSVAVRRVKATQDITVKGVRAGNPTRR